MNLIFLLWCSRCNGVNRRNMMKADLITFYMFTYSPSNFIITIIVLFSWGFNSLIDYVEKLIKKKKDIKERNFKIKLGIIRINLNDPYGEENWNE